MLVAGIAYSRLPRNRQAGAFSFHPSTPYFHYSPAVAPARGRILVVHGLDSSKDVMNLLCYALADAGFELYSIDLPGHGGSRDPFDGLRARHAVEKALDEISPGAVLGHSFGAAILMDLASDREFDSLVLLSPP